MIWCPAFLGARSADELPEFRAAAENLERLFRLSAVLQPVSSLPMASRSPGWWPRSRDHVDVVRAGAWVVGHRGHIRSASTFEAIWLTERQPISTGGPFRIRRRGEVVPGSRSTRLPCPRCCRAD